MRLIDVRMHPRAAPILYSLLEERTPEQSISHRHMPSIAEHNAFVANYGGPHEPYFYWGLIDVNGTIVGHIYLTRRNEIGIQIYNRHQGKGHGTEAVQLLMRLFGKREYLANINPFNQASIAMFMKLGFGLCQLTYRLTDYREARRAG